MGKKNEPPKPTGGLEQNGLEKRLCNCICICQLVSIISGVSLLYLSVIVISPNKKTLDAEFDPRTAVCTTLQRVESQDCDLPSCGEWCMSKGSSCTIVYAKVRRRGSTVRLRDCETRRAMFCSAQEESEAQEFVCSAGDEHTGQCDHLNKFMNCTPVLNTNPDVKDNVTSLCRNITALRDCTVERSDSGVPEKGVIVCTRFTCNSLNGIYECSTGNCRELRNPRCVDRCSNLEMGNIGIVSPDLFHWGRCRSAESNGTQIWSDAQRPLSMYCTSIRNVTDTEMEATDCLNGTLMDEAQFSRITNYKQILAMLAENAEPLFEDNSFVPSETHVEIFNHSKVMINIQGCVNTLQKECTRWHAENGRDGSDGMHPAVYPCYITPHATDYVITHYDRKETVFQLVLAAVIPSTLVILSCCCLVLCGKNVGVNEYGLFFCKPCHKQDGDGGKEPTKQGAP